MFSATKTLAAAAIFATTGFFLLGVTSEPPDAAPAASTEFTQPDLEASYVSGSVIALEEQVFEGGQPTNIGPYLFEWTTEPTAVRWESSDPRLQGTGTTIEHGLQQTQRYAGIRSERWALENDEGAWVGSGDSYSSPAGGRGFVVLRGTGAYDGLTAYVAMDHDGPDEETMALFEGIVLPEPPPSLPGE